MARDFEWKLEEARWAKDMADKTLRTVENMPPRHVYLITLRNGNRMLAFPRKYQSNAIKFEALGKDEGFNAAVGGCMFDLGYSHLSEPDSMTFRRVPKDELPLYITMYKVYPGLEKAMKGRIKTDE